MSISMLKMARGRAVRGALTAALAAAFGVGVAVASPTAALAATPTCNSEWYFSSTSSGDFNVNTPAYHSGSSYTKVCTLKEGNSGEGVWSLQNALNQCYGF